MQTLIYKTELAVERAPVWLAPNSPVELHSQADGTVAAFAQRPSGWLTRFGLSRPVRIGVLNEAAGDLLRPILDVRTPLRIRIVELQPAHLAADRRARISVSVWGSVVKTTPPSVFSRVGPA
ncbi:hypothetical protein M3N55_12155 [Roseibaca sp. V10]|uniref:HlyD family secretion protein n=1 Tax=Roseinatronobacter domitianus TaxID=2940293 RepID=A0ABT0M3Q5_9RHOB|nr:hypothetical protein [Roseibaca domitiana]MCL1629484.1 hypothetical protein [Roseibaca domitiana]